MAGVDLIERVGDQILLRARAAQEGPDVAVVEHGEGQPEGVARDLHLWNQVLHLSGVPPAPSRFGLIAGHLDDVTVGANGETEKVDLRKEVIPDGSYLVQAPVGKEAGRLLAQGAVRVLFGIDQIGEHVDGRTGRIGNVGIDQEAADDDQHQQHDNGGDLLQQAFDLGMGTVGTYN